MVQKAPTNSRNVYSAVATLSDTQASLLTELMKYREPVTVARLADDLDFHPNTVRAAIETLMDSNLVDRERLHDGGRGRPSWGYYPLAPDPQLFTAAQRGEVTSVFLGALRDIPGDLCETVRRVGKRLSEVLWRRLSITSRAGTISDDAPFSARVCHLRMMHTAMGHSASTSHADPSVIELHSCPFARDDGMVDPAVCKMHRAVLDALMDKLYNGQTAVRLEPLAEDGVCKVTVLRHQGVGRD